MRNFSTVMELNGGQRIDGIERVTGENPDLSIIWLHGLGADATDFLPLIGELELPTDCRFVFPNAPERPVTINGGAIMRAWFDIFGFGFDEPDDIDGLKGSIAIVHRLIAHESSRGMPSERIVLAGFSQGGAVALHAGLTATPPVAGIIGLSTFVPAQHLLQESTELAVETPVMLAHGLGDPVIPLDMARQSAQALRNLDVDIDWSTYPMGHEVCRNELNAVSRWLQRFATR